MQDGRRRPLALTYSRVSNPNDERTASLDSQEEATVALLVARGYEVPPEYRFRERWTGMESIYDRPVLNRARRLIESGEVQAWGSYDTDRLARDPKDLITMIGAIHKAGAEPIFVKFDHIAKDRIGEATVYMKGLASALQWDAIRDATMRGRMEIYGAGQWMGYGRCRYGYVWNKEQRSRSAHPQHADVVRRIYRDVASGILPSEVARQLVLEGVPPPCKKPWVCQTIRQLIKEQTYKGVCIGRQTISTGKKGPNGALIMVPRPAEEQVPLSDARTEALVTEELWAAANAALKSRLRQKHSPGQRRANFLLAGVVWCDKEGCGCRMTPVAQKRCGRIDRFYRCTGNYPSRREKTGCARYLGAKRLEADAWYQIERLLFEPGLVEAELDRIERSNVEQAIETDLKSAEGRRRKIEKNVKAMLDAQAETDSKLLLAALKEKIGVLDKEAEALDEQINRLRAALAPHRDTHAAIDGFKAQLESLRGEARDGSLTFEDKRRILVALDVRVFAVPGRCRVNVDVQSNLGSSTRIWD
jgi:DNA invertase Pin-like site-specific DNA recombinase